MRFMRIQSHLFDSIPTVQYGFGTLHEPFPKPLFQRWSTRAPLWKQVHGTNIAFIHKAQQACGEVDGLYTHTPGLPIAVMTADCVPLLLSHQTGQRIAVLHAGWRGTLAKIVQKFFDQLQIEGETPEHWVGVVGPAIGPCCYTVAHALTMDFKKAFDDTLGSNVAVPHPGVIDLPSLHEHTLHHLGLKQVEVIRICTQCSQNPLLNSYRRTQTPQRQWSVLMQRESLA